MPTHKFTPMFKKTAEGANNGEVVAPILQNYLWDPKFKAFPMKMPDFRKRPPDGWFHPSTHPTWDERMLYYYLQASEEEIPWDPDPFDPASVMAVTQGHFWHEFTGACLKDAGYLSETEVYVEDLATGSRGSMDGIGSVGNTPEVWEYKTMGRNKARYIEQGSPTDPIVLASFKKYCPDYYYQGQEYLRLSGYRRWRALIQTLEYPYSMREIVMEFDPWVSAEIVDKYTRVRAAFEERQPPTYCCHPGSAASKACPARGTCPMATGAL